MPELPEVETIRRGLAPRLEGRRIVRVLATRPDLRFPLPQGLSPRLEGQTIVALDRRAKYLLFRLSGGETLLSHLGMTGNYRFMTGALPAPTRYRDTVPEQKHDHVLIGLSGGDGPDDTLIYSDPRRFGFIDLIGVDGRSPYLDHLGPEPLGNDLSAPALAPRLAGRRTPLKAALLDQRIIAGLGNIYVSEALWRARLSPLAPAASLVRADGSPEEGLERLVAAIRAVLDDALAAGGSTLKDYRDAEGGSGYFQHTFAVYDRASEPCQTPGCTGIVARIVQSGRSSFFCPTCQPAPKPPRAAPKRRKTS